MVFLFNLFDGLPNFGGNCDLSFSFSSQIMQKIYEME